MAWGSLINKLDRHILAEQKQALMSHTPDPGTWLRGWHQASDICAQSPNGERSTIYCPNQNTNRRISLQKTIGYRPSTTGVHSMVSTHALWSRPRPRLLAFGCLRYHTTARAAALGTNTGPRCLVWSQPNGPALPRLPALDPTKPSSPYHATHKTQYAVIPTPWLASIVAADGPASVGDVGDPPIGCHRQM